MIEKKRWPKWESVLEVWNNQKVPNVDVISFDINHHYPTLPWLNKETGQQLIGSTNPQNSTAYHLCSYLPSKAPELMVPYKVLAFCRNYDLHSSFST